MRSVCLRTIRKCERMTYWETFKKIEEETGKLKTGLAGMDVNVWVDNVFRASGFLQEKHMQVLLSNREHDVKYYRVWENSIFIIAETKGV